MKLFRTFLSLTFIYTLLFTAVQVATGAIPLVDPGVIGGMLIFTAPRGVCVPF